MKFSKIGINSASRIALGCMRISDMGPNKAQELIEKSLDVGINFFDHADIYGAGKSEELFGHVIKRVPSLREKMIIQSKCGIRKGFYDFSKEHILSSVDGILQRLGIGYIDILLLHRPDTLFEPDEVAEAFNNLYDSGKVRGFGVSNMNCGQIALLQKSCKQSLDVNQLQFSIAHTGLIDQGFNVNMTNEPSIDHNGGILEYCRLNNITIQAWSPLQYGFFEGTFIDNEKYSELNILLEKLSKKYEISKAAVAIAWILRHPANIQVVLGSTNCSRVTDIAKSADIIITREEWYELYRAAGNKLP